MKSGYPSLTEHEVRTQFHTMPAELFGLAMGKKAYEDVISRRIAAEAKGGRLDIFFWPNGTTIFWEQPDAKAPLDVEELIRAYHAFHRGVALYYSEAPSC